MNVLVLFGSKSDENVYTPLCESLADHNVSFEVISAHRDPARLGERLAQKDFDCIVAGAGIAAHLPGVIASKTKKPVFGVPVGAHLDGLDALLSIQQMPYGVPVLAVGVNQEKSINEYINSFSKITDFSNINIVLDKEKLKQTYVAKEFKRFDELALKSNIKVNISEEASDEVFNIIYVFDKSDIKPSQKNSIHVPILDEKPASAALTILEWSNTGGLWVAINNSRNALLSFLKWEE